MAIKAQEAARKAADYYREISGEISYRQEVTVEEVEMDGGYWIITLGFAEQSYSLNSPKSKDYKIFKVDVASGDIISMKIRTLN